MRTKSLFFCAFALAAFLLIGYGCTSKPVNLQAVCRGGFLQKSGKGNFSLSPDGKFYAYMAPYSGMLNVFVREIGKEAEMQLTYDTLRSVYGFFWANNDRILYIKDSGGDENMKLYGVNKDGSTLKSWLIFQRCAWR